MPAPTAPAGAIDIPIATCSRGVKILPDLYFDAASSGPVSTPYDHCYLKTLIVLQDKYDLLVVPGGAKGADTISQNTAVQDLVRKYINVGKFVGMICAGQ